MRLLRYASPVEARTKARRRSVEKGGRADVEPRPRVRLEVDERRSQLIELGLAQFASRSYDDVSIELIAQQAGISKGLLYHYFPTKRAFYVACIREAAARLLARIGEVPRDAPPLDRLRAGLDAYLGYVRAHARAYVALMRGGIGVDPEINAVIDETRASLLAQLTSDMAVALPGGSDTVTSPLLRVALRGWIGLAEAASIAWVEACVEADTRTDASKGRRGEGAEAGAERPNAPSGAEVRELLTQALIAIIEGALKR